MVIDDQATGKLAFRVFRDEVLAEAKRADDPPEEMPERLNLGKNIIGTTRIQLCAKSFILQTYDVLARHNLRSLRGSESTQYPTRALLSFRGSCQASGTYAFDHRNCSLGAAQRALSLG